MFGIKGFAKGIAKAQLRSFFAYRSKYPNMKTQELYLGALKTRRTVSEEIILGWIRESKNFQEVIICLAQYEFLTNRGDIGREEMRKIDEAVRQTVPANL
jgi:hypothetical protein